MSKRKPTTRRHQNARGYFRRVIFEPLETRSLLAPLVNVGSASDLVFNLPAAASTAILEDDGIAGNGISQLRSTNGSFDTTPFANPTGSLTINRGNAADAFTINALPDFTASLTLATADARLASITFAGAVNLAADKSLTAYAEGTISLSNSASRLATTGSGAISLTTARDISLSGFSRIITVDGNLTLSANQQAVPATGSFAGIDLNRATVQVTGTGKLAFYGRGGGALSTSNHGIQLRSGAVVGSTSTAVGAGTVTLQGRVGEGSQSSAGVALFNEETSVSSVTGNITIVGLPADTASATNWGILQGEGATISSTGSATIALSGTGGPGRFNNDGIVMAGVIRSASGDITLTGQGGTATGVGSWDDNDGIEILGTIESTGTANINIVGQGGVGTLFNQGVQIEGLVASASGKITISGTGGQGTMSSNGVLVEGTQGRIRSVDGDISISGLGGTSTLNQFSAVGIGGAGIQSTGSAKITISGSGTGNSHGVSFTSPITSASPVRITGISSFPGPGIIAQGGIDTSLTGAAIELIADDVMIGTQPIRAGNGTVRIHPATAGHAIDLGGADSSSSLGLTDAELDAITAGTIQIGDANSGPITVSAAITRTDSTSFSLTSGSTISLPNATSQLATTGTGAISLTTPRNISLASGSSITSVDGPITLSANQQATPASGSFVGVDVNAATIQATGAGAVIVWGIGGDALSGFQHGVHVRATARVIGGTGGVQIVAQGRGSSSSSNNAGVYIDRSQVNAAGAGEVIVQGTGGAGSGGFNYGVSINNQFAVITSSGGNVRVTGQGGGTTTSGSNVGVYIRASGSGVSAGGAGMATVQGTGGAGSGSGNHGVFLFGPASAITSSGGNIQVTGQGGGSGASPFNIGVYLDASQISAGGMGTVTVVGTGGNGSGINNHGVLLTGGGGVGIFASDGDVQVTGQGGGAGTAGSGVGVHIQSAGAIVAGGSGSLVVQGTGGPGSGAGNTGVFLSSSFASLSSAGTVQVTGKEGGGTSGLAISVAGSIAAQTSLQLVGNSMALGSTATIAAGATGMVTLQPRTPGVGIDLGQSTDPIGGPLSLTDAELDRITAGTLQIGDAKSGPITVSAAITRSNSTNLSLTSASTISLPNAESQLVTTGTGAISLTTPRNISLASGSKITSVDGPITLSANQQATPTTGNFVGIDVNAATIQATGSGAITVQGKGGDTSSGKYGVRVRSGGLVESGTGGLLVVGHGGSVTSGPSAQNYGVYVDSGGQLRAAGSGPVTVQGTGGFSSGGGSDGVRVRDNSSAIISGDGDVRVTGQGGSSTSIGVSYGVQVDALAQVSAVGSGAVIVQGTGGAESPGSMNAGVRLWSSGVISASAGDVRITGQGGGSGASGLNHGVEIVSARANAGSGGQITIQGNGGAGSGDANHGVWITAASEITSADGNIQITGQGGGSGASGSNYGVLMHGKIRAEGGGVVLVQGTGGTGSGNDNFGVVANSLLTVGSTVQITGIEGAGPSGTAVVATSGAISTAASRGPLTLIGNSMNLVGTADITAGPTGTVTLKPYIPGVAINLGQPTDPIGGPLSLTDAELARITAGTIQIGDTNSGPITVSAPLTLSGKNLTLVTSAGVSGGAAITNGSTTAATVTLDQAGNSTYSGSLSGQNLAFTKRGTGTLTITGNNNYTGDTTISQGVLRIQADGVIPWGAGKGNVVFNPDSGTAKLEVASTGGSIIHLNGLWSSGAGASIIDNTVGGQDALWVGYNDQTSTFGGDIRNSAGTLRLGKNGTGTLTLNGSLTNWRTDLLEGTLLVNGTATGQIEATGLNVRTLGGSGTVGPIVLPGHVAYLSPGSGGPGILSSGNASGVGTFEVDINGPSPGAQYDQLNVAGTVLIGGTALRISLGYTPAAGDQFTIINNDGSDAIFGTFRDWSEGRIFTVTTGPFTATFQITYQGGDGNDVVLTALNQAPTLDVNLPPLTPAAILPHLMTDINPGAAPSMVGPIEVVYGIAYFAAETPDTGVELWRSDGTAAGTWLVKDIFPGPGSSRPAELTNVNGILYFRADDPTHGVELWRSSGIAVSTVLVKDLVAGSPSSYPGNFIDVNGKLFFTAADQPSGPTEFFGPSPYLSSADSPFNLADLGTDFWLEDFEDGALNTPGVSAVSGSVRAPSSQTDSVDADDGVIDGSGKAGHSYLVRPGSQGITFEFDANVLGGLPSYVGIVTTNGFGGSPASAVEYFDAAGNLIARQSNPVDNLQTTTADDRFLGIFHAGGIKSMRVSSVGTGNAGLEVDHLQYGSIVQLTGSAALWTSDGSDAGTVLLKNLDFSPDFSAASLNGKLLFTANDGVSGTELWTSDGTPNGTTQIFDINPGPASSKSKSLTRVSNTVYFQADDGTTGPELWKTDGSLGGTALVKDIRPGAAGSNPAELTSFQGALFFSATTSANGTELWTSDGSDAGTTLVKEIRPSANSSGVSELTAVGNTLYFIANNNVQLFELWKSDGTEAGTVLVKDIVPGGNSSNPMSLANINGRLLFSAFTPANGHELWFSDGTSTGTQLINDINPGEAFSAPLEIVALPHWIVFTAADGTHGRELWSASLDAMSVLEEADTQSIPLTGISAGAGAAQTLNISAISDNPALVPHPTIKYTNPQTAGTLSFTPVANQSGIATITVTIKDDGGTIGGGVDTLVRTFTVVVVPVNDAPSFTSGGDLSVTDEDPAQSFADWAAPLATGPADESAQTLTFVVSTDNPGLFLIPPAIDPTGTLTFTPAPNVAGTAQVTVTLKDSGGTANGGVDTSAPQTFTIDITKPHRWHNAANNLDASGDSHIAPNDPLEIINYINAFGAGAVPVSATSGPPYLDVNGDDFVSAADVLDVINYLNAFGPTVTASGQAEGEATPAAAASSTMNAQATDDWLALLAEDLAMSVKRSRR